MLIPLTQNQSTQVSPQDYDYLSKFNWHLHSKGYATRCIRKGQKREQVLMHRTILDRMGVNLEDKLTDHRNRNKLDNRRKNLRAVSDYESLSNRKVNGKYKLKPSGVKGVSFHKNHKKWRAYVGNKHLGYFDTKTEAIKARKKAERIN